MIKSNLLRSGVAGERALGFSPTALQAVAGRMRQTTPACSGGCGRSNGVRLCPKTQFFLKGCRDDAEF